MLGFFLKLLGASLFLSLAIKYGGPRLPISGTTPTALIAVCVPSLILGIIFSWRWRRLR